MASCSVCGDDDRFLHTCNHCGKKHCPDHQLPENHVCIPKKSELSDADGSSDRWFSEKHERSNVMADESRGERKIIEDPDPHLEETETKRPLDEDEIDADTSSSPHEWVRDVQENREELNRRLQERHRAWESENSSTSDEETSSSHPASQRDYSASTPPSPMTGSSSTESNTDTPQRIPSALWIIALLVLLVIAYVAIGAI
ncbi:AN1-type zinc finger protein [Halolamina salifodinae]|uniref:AN1-type domain-containing protein n=1 Tax=Halolamina salifodinae TaxID=1202767 RepID=A0A8T4H1M6_9EURY|nr:AN1-type zinc finger protein [Halolamina salifodinae]MBP1987218.1 hypothetical protein [Halolamina salifodinae]